jgi:8-amino-7-oxononanoate synthase
MALDDDSAAELALLADRGLRRGRRVVSGRQGVRLVIDGREVVSFSSNDYLGLAGHAALEEAATDGLRRAGVGAGASRLIVGNTMDHERLERAVAAWLELPAACLFNSGFAANTGVLPVVAGAGDVIFSDELNHASLIDGCRLAKAEVVVYRHGDLADLECKLGERRGRRAVVVTETLFSMDGDVVDIVELDRLRRRFGAALIVDEAHALGAMGEGGRGIAIPAGVVPDLVIGTLGKALGSHGAFAAGGTATIDLLWNRARTLVFSTGMPPAIASASVAAIELVRGAEGERRRGALAANIARMRPRSAPAAIQPVRVGDARRVMEISEALLAEGIFVQGIRPPTVPAGTSRLRIALSADHHANNMILLHDALRRFT